MESLLVYKIALIAALGIGAQWLAWRLHLPTIVLLFLAGVLVGPVLGWIDPVVDFGAWFHPIIAVAVCLILFEGGLNLDYAELGSAVPAVRRLIIVGIPITWSLSTLAAYFVAGLSWPVAFVLGAILVVTGPTVIMPLLRQARVSPPVSSILKWEGIINDPLGALLAIIVFETVVLAEPGGSLAEGALRFALGIGGAAILGLAAAWVIAWAFRGGHVPEFLKGPAVVAVVLGIYVAANALQQESGLVAATVMGIGLANMRMAGIAEMRRLKEYVTVLLIAGVFIILTATLEPAHLEAIDWRVAAFLGALLFVRRPLAGLLATLRTELDWRQRALVAWIAPRGIVAVAVAGLFGPTLAARGIPDADLLVPLCFAVVGTTVVAHGFTLGWLGRKLGLAAASRNGVLIVGANPWSTALAEMLMKQKVPVRLADSAWDHTRDARLRGIPIYYGEMLSEPTEYRLDLSNVNYLIAASDNDAYNSLVCTTFAHELGRTNVFQVAVVEDETDQRAIRLTLRGRRLIGKEFTLDELLRRIYSGWKFKAVRISEAFDYTAAVQARAPSAAPVMVIREDGDLVFNTPEGELEPEPGDTLVTFAPAEHAPGEVPPPPGTEGETTGKKRARREGEAAERAEEAEAEAAEEGEEEGGKPEAAGEVIESGGPPPRKSGV